MILIYLHGFRSDNKSSKVDELKQMFPDWKVKSPKYQPHNPKAAEKSLTEFFNSAEMNDEIIVIGTSLGGFWARWCAAQFGCKALLINPSIEPWKIPPGQYSNYKDGSTFEVTEEMLSSFKDFENNDGQFVVVLAKDDELLPAAHTKKYFLSKGINQIIEFETGGHRFSGIERVKKLLKDMS